MDALLLEPSTVDLTDGDSGAGVGESEKNLRSLFDVALRHAEDEGTTVLLFNPVDAFCPLSAAQSSKPRTRRLALRFLGLVEEYLPRSENLFVIGFTGRFDGASEAALGAPGRLSTRVMNDVCFSRSLPDFK